MKDRDSEVEENSVIQTILEASDSLLIVCSGMYDKFLVRSKEDFTVTNIVNHEFGGLACGVTLENKKNYLGFEQKTEKEEERIGYLAEFNLSKNNIERFIKTENPIF